MVTTHASNDNIIIIIIVVIIIINIIIIFYNIPIQSIFVAYYKCVNIIYIYIYLLTL